MYWWLSPMLFALGQILLLFAARPENDDRMGQPIMYMVFGTALMTLAAWMWRLP
jgi:uncharacterized membrane protein YhhN